MLSENTYGAVYVGTCSVNDKQYVGQTTARDPERYCIGHIYGARRGLNKLLYEAIREHGAENFKFEIVGYAEDKTALDLLEDFLILILGTLHPRGYNMRRGGSHGKFSEESKRKLSISLNSPDTQAKLAAIYADPKVIERKSIAMILVHQRPEHQQKLAETNAKVEVRRRRSESQREVVNRPGYRENLSEKQQFRFSNLEQIEHQRLKSLEQFADPIKRENHKNAYDNPITREKIGAINGNSRWATDGAKNRRLKVNESLPPGWYYGTSSYGSNGKTDRATAQTIGRHNRWHTSRGIVNPECPLCRPPT